MDNDTIYKLVGVVALVGLSYFLYVCLRKPDFLKPMGKKKTKAKRH